MAAATVDITTSCLCGKTSFTVSLEKSALPLKAWLCHCNACRRTHGTLCTFHADWPKPPASFFDTVTAYQGKRHFCSTCGAHMLHSSPAQSEPWTVSTGLVDVEKSDDIFAFGSHIYASDTKDGGMSDWITAVNGRPMQVFAAEEGVSAEESQARGADMAAELQAAQREDKLYGRCQCKGVEFYISRPDVDAGSEAHFSNDRELLFRLGPKDDRWQAANCFCNSCRRSSGCEITSFAFVATTHVTMADGSPFSMDYGTLRSYQSSPGKARAFCNRCGACVFYWTTGRPGGVDVNVGLLNAESGARAEEWLWWEPEPEFGEDAIHKGLVTALRDGMKAYRKN